VFKNGRIYEGTFDNDRIVEFPAFDVDGFTTPDISKIQTRTPLPSGNAILYPISIVKFELKLFQVVD